jgi:hypothetical protein
MTKSQRDLLMKAILQYGIWTYRLGQQDPQHKGAYEKILEKRATHFKAITDFIDAAVDIESVN